MNTKMKSILALLCVLMFVKTYEYSAEAAQSQNIQVQGRIGANSIVDPEVIPEKNPEATPEKNPGVTPETNPEAIPETNPIATPETNLEKVYKVVQNNSAQEFPQTGSKTSSMSLLGIGVLSLGVILYRLNRKKKEISH